jgi:hypothetical protein
METLGRQRSPSTSRSPSTYGGKPDTLSEGAEVEGQARLKTKAQRQGEVIVEETFVAEEGGVDFRGLGWKGAVVLLVKT